MQHAWRIDEREYRRHEIRRGRRHAFAAIDPTRTALVVVDMVPFFVDANPYTAGAIIAWVLPANPPPAPARAEFLGPEIADRYRDSGGTGALADRLWHEF